MTKRPLFALSVFFLAELAALQLWGRNTGFAAAGAALLLLACLPRGKARRLFPLALLACLGALGAFWFHQERLESWSRLTGTTVPFTGWLEEVSPYDPGRVTLLGRVPWGDKERQVRLTLSGMEEPAAPGQWFSGELLVLGAREDGDAPGGVSLTGRAGEGWEPVPAPEGFHPLAKLAALRWSLSQRIWERRPGEDTAVVLAMIVSRSGYLSRNRLAELNQAGLRHLLVVSGLHLALATGWLRPLSRGLGSRIGVAALGLVCVWGMAGLAGFSPSVLRAAAMTSLFLLGQLLFRQADAMTSLGAAGLLLGLLSPPVLFRAGWQLTFAATLGILVGTGPLFVLLESCWTARFGPPGKGARWALEGLAATVCAQLGVLPVLACRLGSVTLWGLVTTLPAIPLATGILLLGGAGALFLALPFAAPLGGVLLDLARLPARLLLGLAGAAARLPDLSFPVLFPWQLALCFLLSAGAFCCLMLGPRLPPRWGRRLLGGMLSLAALTLVSPGLILRDAALVSVDASGAVVIIVPEGTVVLDAGTGPWERQALSERLIRYKGKEPLVAAFSREPSWNGVLYLDQELSPGLVRCPPGPDTSLLMAQLPTCRPLGEEREEVLPGVFLSSPWPGTVLAEAAGRKVLKSQAAYAIINRSPPEELPDLWVDRNGRVYSGPGAGESLPMVTGDTNFIFRRTGP
ncbi:MAG: ComEC/Rec2 family competence protein [Angelakisella sp.]|nr:ComEC/Rec2 family competence protein [Angelakisella sp.]